MTKVRCLIYTARPRPCHVCEKRDFAAIQVGSTKCTAWVLGEDRRVVFVAKNGINVKKAVAHDMNQQMEHLRRRMSEGFALRRKGHPGLAMLEVAKASRSAEACKEQMHMIESMEWRLERACACEVAALLADRPDLRTRVENDLDRLFAPVFDGKRK